MGFTNICSDPSNNSSQNSSEDEGIIRWYVQTDRLLWTAGVQRDRIISEGKLKTALGLVYRIDAYKVVEALLVDQEEPPESSRGDEFLIKASSVSAWWNEDSCAVKHSDKMINFEWEIEAEKCRTEENAAAEEEQNAFEALAENKKVSSCLWLENAIWS